MNRPDMIKVTPEPGRQVRKPDGHLLAAGGETVPNGSYWRRRFDDGDVSIEIIPAARSRKDKA